MRNRSKIAWKKLSEEKPSKKGTYLVAFFIDKENKSNALTPALVEWHTVGDIIEMHNPALQEEDRSGANGAIKKLMSCFGGSCVNYEVKEDGFYFVGINWDFVHGDKGEDGCVEYVECLGQDVFWADVPLMPEGYITIEESEEIENTDRENQKRKDQDEKAEAMSQRFETDAFLAQNFPLEKTFPNGISIGTQVETSRYGVLCRMPSTEYASLLCSTSDIILIVKQMVNDGYSFDSVSQMPIEERKEFFAKIVKEAGVKDVKSIKQAVYYFDVYKNRDDIFFARCRTCLKDKIGGGKENMPKILVGAKAESNRAYFLYQLEHFFQMQQEMDVPDVIVTIKSRDFAYAHTAAFMTDCVVGISNENEYARSFNVDSNGNYAECSREYLLDDEKVIVENDSPDDIDNDKTPHAEDLSDGFANEKEPVIGVDFPYYAVAMSPNHLMYEADFAIRDNSSGTYVFGEDGKELIFAEWEDAKKKRDELEAKAIA